MQFEIHSHDKANRSERCDVRMCPSYNLLLKHKKKYDQYFQKTLSEMTGQINDLRTARSFIEKQINKDCQGRKKVTFEIDDQEPNKKEMHAKKP